MEPPEAADGCVLSDAGKAGGQGGVGATSDVRPQDTPLFHDKGHVEQGRSERGNASKPADRPAIR